MEEFAGTNLWFRNDAVIAWNKINGGGAQLFCAGGFVFKLDKDAFEALLMKVQARKQEVTLQESKKARERYLEFMQSCDRGVVVNSDQELPKVELQVRESIMQVMERKSY